MRAASASAGVSADGCFSGCLFGGGQNKPIESFSYANATFIAANPSLELFAGDPQLEAQFLNMLELGLYLIGDANFMHEVSAYGLYNPNSGKISFVLGNYPESSGPGWTAMPVLPKIANGTIVIAMHTHPATGHYFTNQSGKRVYGLAFPSKADIALAGSSGIPGMVVTGGGVIYGYDGAGYQ